MDLIIDERMREIEKQKLKQLGYTNVYDLGSINNWK